MIPMQASHKTNVHMYYYTYTIIVHNMQMRHWNELFMASEALDAV